MESDGARPGKNEEGKQKDPAKSENLAPGGAEAPRVEVSAATVTRMMGIPTLTDLKLIEGRIDLLTAKVTGMMTKLDRVVSGFNALPTASDMDRIDIQIGSMKSVMKEILEAVGTDGESKKDDDRAGAQEQSRKLREGIRSSSGSDE